MYTILKVIFISLTINCALGYPGYWNSPTLSPVHGLYVKPSGDGVTGDLFVAATEDNGVKSQWAVDQPINFLQVASTSKPLTHAVPMAYPGFPASHDESPTQKRAVMPSPVANPPVQYAYALPVPSSESNSLATYPYVYPVQSNPSETSTPKCDPSSTASTYPSQFPFQFFYPQLMSAYSNAMTILKDTGLSDDTANSVLTQASPTWPSSSYAYPMYVMVDPSAWVQNLSSTTPSTSTAAPSAPEEESTQTKQL